jgi:hypothetical protein
MRLSNSISNDFTAGTMVAPALRDGDKGRPYTSYF